MEILILRRGMRGGRGDERVRRSEGVVERRESGVGGVEGGRR
jgi:hypothetical protein